MADVTAVYTMSDKEVMQALDRIDKRMGQHEARAKKSMDAAGGTLSNAIAGSAVRALAGVASITKGIQFATEAMADYAKRNSQVTEAFETMGREWNGLRMDIGRDLSVLTIGGDSWINSLIRGVRKVRKEWVDAVAGGIGSLGLGSNGAGEDPISELRRIEEIDREIAAGAMSRDSLLQAQSQLSDDPLDRVRAGARLERQNRMKEIDAIRVNGQQLTPGEKAPMIRIAMLKEEKQISNEIARIEERRAADQQRLAKAEEDAFERYKQGLLASAEVGFMERENEAQIMRLEGLEKQADATEILIDAERRLLRQRNDKQLSPEARARAEDAILRRAGIDLNALGADRGKTISGASIGAGLGGGLSARVFGVGPAGETKQNKAIDLAKQQLNALQQIATNTRGPQVAVFGP